MTGPDGYDALPYESIAFPETHPARLGGVAHLHGMASALPATARVLELGCASGGNIIPMAASLPGARFVGVDFSRRQVDTGQGLLAELDLGNCELLCADLSDVTLDGEFDYIIAHGVYSWVAEPVRDSLLALCRDHLAVNGVACISFNTLPGWHQKQVLRDFLLFHQRNLGDDGNNLDVVRDGFMRLAGLPRAPDTVYARMLDENRDKLETHSNSYLAHDHLEPVNEPVYFTDFAEHARQFDLGYLCEARLTQRQDVQGLLNLPAQPGQVEREQYYDFIEGTQFRRAVLYRAGDRPASAPIEDSPIHFSTVSALSFKAQMGGKTLCEFAGGKTILKPGRTLRTLQTLAAAWPESLPGDALVERGGSLEELDKLALAGIVTRHLGEPVVLGSSMASEPRAPALARLQARDGQPVTSLIHDNVQLNEFQRQCLQQLDGTRSHGDLEAWIASLVEQGVIRIEGAPGGTDVSAGVLRETLGIFSRMALLL